MDILHNFALVALVPIVGFAVWYCRARNRVLAGASLAWGAGALYALYGTSLLWGSCTGDCYVGLELIVIVPALLVISLVAVALASQRRPRTSEKAVPGYPGTGGSAIAMHEEQVASVSGLSSPTMGSEEKMVGALAYVIFFIPLIVRPSSAFGRYHANQGLILFMIEILAWLSGSLLVFIPGTGFLIKALLNIVAISFFVIGVVNASKGEKRPLPVVGGLRLIS